MPAGLKASLVPSKLKNKEANSFLIFKLCDYLVTCILSKEGQKAFLT